MQLPSKIVDITMPLDTETVVDPEIMRPQIKYVNHQENAETMANFFDGMKPEDLPDGQAWAWEIITLTTHNGTLIWMRPGITILMTKTATACRPSMSCPWIGSFDRA